MQSTGSFVCRLHGVHKVFQLLRNRPYNQAVVKSSGPRLAQGEHFVPKRLLCGLKTATSDEVSTSTAPSPPSPLVLGEMAWPGRSHLCGTLRDDSAGQRVDICGWVDRYRNHGGVLFIDIRDHTGLLQVVSEPLTHPEVNVTAERLRNEYVVAISGVLRIRQDPNPKMDTGDVELLADRITVVNTVNRRLPFPISEGEETDPPREDLRLRHRVLDLRRPRMGANLRLRHTIVKTIRRVLEDQHGFMEVETPILTRSTPEGARDYLVPSRVQGGSWYALPQSPQLFKQMLMVAGYDRYYQIARCFRDEDLRADRQPEFTQLDMEMAFMDQEGVLALVEGMVSAVFSAVKGKPIKTPIERMTYKEAMDTYGSDRPDTRFGFPMSDVSEVLAGSGFRVFADCISSGGMVKALRVPDGKRLSNSRLKPKGDVAGKAAAGGAKGLVYIRVQEDGQIDAAKPVREGLDDSQRSNLIKRTQAVPGDLLLLVADQEAVVNRSLDKVRQFLGRDLNEIDPAKDALLWVTDFPMFEENSDEGRLEALHHPFTAPESSSVGPDGDLRKATAMAYDLIYNGVEIGGGSLRVYRRDVQERVFDAIGMSEEEAKDKFGFLLDCFDSGAPPHAGIAFGLDRLAMLLTGANSIRDVIAFPKTTQAECLLTGSPATVDSQQLSELGVKSLPKKESE
ncbi:hypothetical protein BSKO_02962 [Bryopsis sp. KO-2023]|nr:hypothetical protein BSKO_02962 [Bryopsis sp. KO-2023]